MTIKLYADETFVKYFYSFEVIPKNSKPFRQAKVNTVQFSVYTLNVQKVKSKNFISLFILICGILNCRTCRRQLSYYISQYCMSAVLYVSILYVSSMSAVLYVSILYVSILYVSCMSVQYTVCQQNCMSVYCMCLLQKLSIFRWALSPTPHIKNCWTPQPLHLGKTANCLHITRSLV